MLKLFLSFELTKKVKYFKSKTLAKVITALLFFGVFLFVGIGIYFFFVSGFRFINTEASQDIRSALTLFIYEIFLLILSGVIIFSSMVSAIFNLYKSETNRWIIASPSYKDFPKVVLIRSLSNTFLLTIIMFLPAIIAFNKVYSLPVVNILCILLSVVAYLFFLNAITLLTIVLGTHVYYKISVYNKKIRFSFKGLIALLLIFSTLLVSTLVRIITKVDLVKLFKADEDSAFIAITTISQHFAYLPTHPLALEILNWQTGMSRNAVIDFSIIILITFIATTLWWKLSYFYYRSWQTFQEGGGLSNSIPEHTTKNKPYLFTGNPLLALFKKEALVSTRNYKGILWFFFLFFIWLLQVGTNVALHNNISRYGTDITEKSAILQALQFIIAIYFICAFALRFVFPSFSVEKKTSWILESAPLTFAKIFLSKYVFYTLTFLFIGFLMEYINILILKVPFVHASFSMLLFVSSIIFIITLALFLGSLFPSHESDDPEAISTSMPGLTFTALSLLYGALNAFILYSTFLYEKINLIIIVVLITIIAVGAMLAFILLSSKKICL